MREENLNIKTDVHHYIMVCASVGMLEYAIRKTKKWRTQKASEIILRRSDERIHAFLHVGKMCGAHFPT